MSSIGSILSIARSAIFANQAAIQVTSHNISNVNTEGYSRQRPLLTTHVPVRLGAYTVGSGVAVHDVTRIRDSYLDLSVRRESSNGCSRNCKTR
jgi:flagellar hook-associated protein 1